MLASAAGLAGLRALHGQGRLPEGLRIVLINTSSGLKNLEAIESEYPEPEMELSS